MKKGGFSSAASSTDSDYKWPTHVTKIQLVGYFFRLLSMACTLKNLIFDMLIE